MKYRYHGKIKFTMDKNHPDIKYVNDWRPNKIYEFDDFYEFDADRGYTKEEIHSYIKRDLALVAGGGYNADHIHNVKISIY